MALRFVSTSSQYGATSGSATALDLLTGVSWMAWLNPATLRSNFQPAFSRQVATFDETIWMGMNPSNQWGCFISTDTALGQSIFVASPAPVPGTTAHVAATWGAASDLLRLYINGTQVGSLAVAGSTLRATSTPFVIAGNVNAASPPLPPNEFWDGRIEDLRIYARELGPAEIATIFATRGHDGIVANLIARYPMTDTPNGAAATRIAEITGTPSMQITTLSGATGSDFNSIRSRSRPNRSVIARR